MLEWISNPWVADVAANLVVSVLLLAVGFVIGKWRGRRQLRGRNLEQYAFYPFSVDERGFPQFSPSLFAQGVRHFLKNGDATAATQLIVIGEQNGVRYQLEPETLAQYERLYARYDGQSLLRDSSEYLENYRRIVRLLGATFRGMGIEIVLHDLVNPAHSIDPGDRDWEERTNASSDPPVVMRWV